MNPEPKSLGRREEGEGGGIGGSEGVRGEGMSE